MKFKIKNSTAPWVGLVGLALAFPLAPSHLAQAQQKSRDQATRNEASGQAQRQTNSRSEGGSTQARSELAPHALMVEAGLQSSMIAAKALQAQQKSMPDPASKAALQHAQLYQKMLNQDLRTAMVHAQELQGAIRKYPDLEKSESYQNLQRSMNQLNVSRQMWIASLNKPSYLANKDQVNSDLDKFQNNLKESLEQVSGFSKDHLNVDSDIA